MWASSWMLQPSPTWPASLPLYLACTNTDKCCSLAWPSPHSALVLVLTSGRCSLVGEFFKFPYQAYSQPRISWHTSRCHGLLGMVCLHYRPLHVPPGTAAWPRLASSQPHLPLLSGGFLLGEFYDPAWLSLLPLLALQVNLRVLQSQHSTKMRPQVHYRICPRSRSWWASRFWWVLHPSLTWPTPCYNSHKQVFWLSLARHFLNSTFCKHQQAYDTI